MDAEFWRDAGALKAVHRRISLADCLEACALSRINAAVGHYRPQGSYSIVDALRGGDQSMRFSA
jgi:hypothetical protein